MCFEFGVFFVEAAEPLDSVLVEEPILMAGGAPFGEVLMGDGFAVEDVSEDGFGFGQIIYPRENGAAKFAVVEAAVELFANGGGEAGDLTDTSRCHIQKDYWIDGFLDGWMRDVLRVAYYVLGWFLVFSSILQYEEKLTVMF